MRIFRQYRFWIAQGLSVMFLVQFLSQAMPVVQVHHAEDQSVCTCGCMDLSREKEHDSCASEGCGALLCLCDQEHKTEVTWPALQIRDIFVETLFSFPVSHSESFSIFPRSHPYSADVIQPIDHPPQS